MPPGPLWRDWIQSHNTYTPELEYGKAIGDALEDFESSLLSEETSVYSVQFDFVSCTVKTDHLDFTKLAALTAVPATNTERYNFFFVNRFLLTDGSGPEPSNGHKLSLSAEALRLLASKYHISPSFLFAVSRFWLPNGRGFRQYIDDAGAKLWYQWYFLPIRIQLPCTDEQRSHATSTAGSNQMNPFHYLHLPWGKVDIRGSQIAIYVCCDQRTGDTTFILFNFMPGRWPKVVRESQDRVLEALRHPSVSRDPMFVHLVLLTMVIRWWNNALHSVNEQLIVYEKRLQEEIAGDAETNTDYNDISKALHAMAAHVHRYTAEVDSLEITASEIARVFGITHGNENASLAGIDLVKSQLQATNAFVKEQEKKIQNILALLFHRMQITNDRMMVSNGKAMHAIMKATQEETAMSREIALRSQELSEDMKKDSVSMKTIAILTMFFLPATSFAALLAMPFFTSNKYLNDTRQVWIWVVLTVPTTAVAYTFYHFWRKHEETRRPRRHDDFEMNRFGLRHRSPSLGHTTGRASESRSWKPPG